MPNNNKKTRGSSQHSHGNPGVGHDSSSGSSRVTDSSSDRSQGNSDRGNQGMGDHGTSRRSENIDSGTRSSGGK